MYPRLIRDASVSNPPVLTGETQSSFANDVSRIPPDDAHVDNMRDPELATRLIVIRVTEDATPGMKQGEHAPARSDPSGASARPEPA